MLHPTLSKLAASRARLLHVIADLPDSALDDRAVNGEWNIRQHLTHLAASEEDHRRVIEAIVGGQSDRLPKHLERDAHNAARLDELGMLSRECLLDVLADQRQHTETLFAQLDAAQLEQTGPHPVLGDITISNIFRIIVIHEQMHTREIGEIRAQMEQR